MIPVQNTFWLGVVVLTGTSQDIISKLNAASRDAIAPPKAMERPGNLGAEISVTSTPDFGKFLAAELTLWSRVVKDAVKVRRARTPAPVIPPGAQPGGLLR
jgi:tripartite-type tricarboxylate transporter receptor subunit TctC